MRFFKLTKWMTIVMLLAGVMAGMSSCNSDDEPQSADIEKALNYDDTWLKSIDLSEPNAAAANAFFSKFHSANKGSSIIFDNLVNFDAFYNDHGKIQCLIINSMTELEKAFPGETSYMPTIDFLNYTVVYGCVFSSSSSDVIRNKVRVKATQDGAIVKVPISKSYIDFCDLEPHFYWNLYPKFLADKVSIQSVTIQN